MSIFSDNRSELYRVIGSEFRIDNKQLKEKEWFNLFFKSSLTFSEDKPTNNNNKITYHNLFDIINNKKHSFLVGAGKSETTEQTIVDFYYGGSDDISKKWKKSLTDKKEFYKIFACDLEWAQPLNFCGGQKKETNINSNEIYNYAGIFKSDKFGIFQITVVNNNGSDKLRILSKSLPEKYSDLILNSTSDKKVFEYPIPDTLLLKNKKITIKYSDDFNTIDYDLPVYGTGKATRIKSDTTTSTTTTDKNDSDKPKQDKPIVNVGRTFYFNKNKDKDDDNMGIDSQSPKKCDDFPYGLDCVNDDIGQINKIFFNNERGNVFSKRLLNKLKDLGYISNNDKDPKITKQMYNDIIKDSTTNIIKESVKKVLKEYINKKK
jgi:hypothetical protein